MEYKIKKAFLVTTLVGALGISMVIQSIKPAAMGPVSHKQTPVRTQSGSVAGTSNSTRSANAVSTALQAASSVAGSTDTANATQVSYGMTNGNYTGQREYAYYGYVRVQAVVKNGKLTQVRVLEHPNDNGTSHYINSVAMPYLVQEAVQAQSANVSLISGATLSSEAFVKSLATALSQAGA